jgi:transcription antitermination protein NusB
VLEELQVAADPFAVELVEGVAAHAGEIDATVSGHATGWTIDRMPILDRNLLRLATFELAHMPETPVGVVIDEAVELAKQYSTEASGGFVNGVLATIARRVRP